MKMTLRKKIVIYILAVLLTACYSVALIGLTKSDNKALAEDSISFITDSKSSYKIVIGKDEKGGGPATIGYCAAYDLQQNLTQAISSTLQICYDAYREAYPSRTILSYSDSNKVICICKDGNKYLEASGLTFSGIEGDSFAIKTKGNNVFIYGKTDNAVLYGTYAFMEDYLGFRFFGNGTHYISKIDNLSFEPIDTVYEPDFDMRTYYTFLTGKPDMQGEYELRMNNEFAGASTGDTGTLRAEGLYWYIGENGEFAVHTALDLVPYDSAHTSWFNGHSDLCYSNVGLNEDGTINVSLETSPVRLAIEAVKQILTDNPDIKYIAIGQEDLDRECECASCQANKTKYGYSGLIIRFVNAISDAIKAWDSEREINFVTLAYQWSLDAPVKESTPNVYVPLDSTVIPRDNVYVRICPMQLNQYYAINDSHQTDPKLLEKWSVVLNQGENKEQAMIWSYNARMSYVFTYFPTMQHWKQDFSSYKDLGVKYVFMQSTSYNATDWKGEMEAYVASKLLWDIDLDPYEIRDEFITYNYPSISNLVKAYVNNFDNLFETLAQGGLLPDMTLQGGDGIVQSTVYGKDFWKTQISLLNQMFEIAKNANDDALLSKVKALALTTYATILYDYDDYGFVASDNISKDNLMYLFFTYCDDLNIVKAGEFKTIADLKEEWGYSDFNMVQGASIRLTEGSTGVRFTAKVSESLYESVILDDTAIFGMMIAPKIYFEGVEIGSDYIAEIAKKGYSVNPIMLYSLPYKVDEEDTCYVINGSIANIRYTNYNREFIGVAFIRTGTEGNYSYQYANLGDYDNVARSVTQVASSARIDDVLVEYFDVLDAFIKGGINSSLGQEQGAEVSNPISFTLTGKFTIGQEILLNGTVTPNNIGLKLVYTSSDTSVAKIFGNTLSLVGAGTVTVTAKCSEFIVAQEITVEKQFEKYYLVNDKVALDLGINYTVKKGEDKVSINGNELTFVSAGSVTISANGYNYTVIVLDFNNLETVVEAWGYGNTIGDNDVTISYVQNVSDGNTSRNALDYSRPSNDGSSGRQRTSSMLFISPEIVTKALDLGYDMISFYAYTPDCAGSTYLGIYRSNDKGALALQTGNALKTVDANGTTWKQYSISLTDLGDGIGIGFAINGKHLYLSDFAFTVAPVSLEKSYVFVDETLTLPNDKFIIAEGGDYATLSGNILTGKKVGNVTLSYYNYSYTINVINSTLTYESGELFDLATAIGVWGYGNTIGDNDVTISYVQNVSDGNTSRNALDYSRPSNNGTNRDRTHNMLYINPDVVSKAVLAGYDYISFYAYIPTYNSIADSTYLGLFNSLNGGLTGENNAIGTAGNNGGEWKYYSIALSALKDNFGIGFAIMGQHLYISDFNFTVAPVALTNTSVFVGSTLTLPNDKFSIVEGGDYATLSGNVLTGVKEGEVTLSYFSYTYTITVIGLNLGNTTGESVDLATDLTLWDFAAGGDANATISYQENVSDAYGIATMNALDYYRPSNTGVNDSRTTKMLYIKADVVSKAVAAGYTYISFYVYIPNMGSSTSTNFALLSTKTGATEGSNNTIWAGTDNGDTWRGYSISLSALKEGFGIGFAFNAQHLYLSNVRFYGADISNVDIVKKYLALNNDRSKDLIDSELIGKLYTTVSNTEEVTYNKPGYTLYESTNGGNDYIQLYKTANVLNVTNIPNGIIISADWIKAAKAAGYKNLALYFKIKDNNAAEILGNGANLFRVRTDNEKVLGAYSQAQTGFVNINLESIKDGEFLVIGFKSDTLWLTGMTFRTAANTSGTGYGWASTNVANSGDLTLYKDE